MSEILMSKKKFNLHKLFRCNFQWTPMHWAAERGHTEIVKILAENKADLNAKDKFEVEDC